MRGKMTGDDARKSLDVVIGFIWGLVVGIVIAAGVSMLLLSGCGPVCKVGAQACKGNRVYTCAPDGWRESINCDTVKTGEWICAKKGSTCACKRKADVR